MNKLFIVYYFISKHGHGYGNAEIVVSTKKLSIDAIREIERKLRDSYCYDNVVIVNIINLESEDDSNEEADE